MEKQDKVIVCKDCKKEFTFTVRDQEYYEQMGFKNEPVRCKECRDKRKAEKNSKRNDGRRDFNRFNDGQQAA